MSLLVIGKTDVFADIEHDQIDLAEPAFDWSDYQLVAVVDSPEVVTSVVLSQCGSRSRVALIAERDDEESFNRARSIGATYLCVLPTAKDWLVDTFLKQAAS